MNYRVSQSKYDYGWIREGGADWLSISSMYLGPPHSFWYYIAPWFVLFFRAFLMSSFVIWILGGWNG